MEITMQRPGKKHKAALSDYDNVNLTSLIRFCKAAQADLEKAGDTDAALRFEIFGEYLLNDFKGGFLKYNSKALGL